MKQPKDGEFWVVEIAGGEREVAQVVGSIGGERLLLTCGDEQGWDEKRDRAKIRFVRKIRL